MHNSFDISLLYVKMCSFNLKANLEFKLMVSTIPEWNRDREIQQKNRYSKQERNAKEKVNGILWMSTKWFSPSKNVIKRRNRMNKIFVLLYSLWYPLMFFHLIWANILYSIVIPRLHFLLLLVTLQEYFWNQH